MPGLVAEPKRRQHHDAPAPNDEELWKMSADNQSAEIFIVDDDPMVRDALCEMFTQAGYPVTKFPDGDSFVAVARKQTPACVILDMFMPGRSGIEVLKDIDARNYPAPIFMASGRGDIPTTVEAIKNGAFDFFEKQRDGCTLVERVRAGVDAFERRRRNGASVDFLRPSFPGSDLLTPRERDVLVQIATGASNKEAACVLGISSRTVEVHRSRIMHKIGAKNSIDLARKVLGRERHA
jgi:FixJ family two-component response regulator